MKNIIIKPYFRTGPLPAQRRFHASEARFRAYIGGFGSGKTYAGSWEAIMLCMRYPGTVGIVCRQTYSELRDSTRLTLFEVLYDIQEYLNNHNTGFKIIHNFYSNANELILNVPGGTSTILFRSLDRPEKFKSANIGWFWIDEASDTNEEAFKILMGRLRHPAQKGGYTGILTTNPCNDRHWIYEKFYSKKTKDFEMFKAPTSENKHLPEGYEESLRASYPEDWVKRYLDGEFGFVATGKRVYPEFNTLRHTKQVRYNKKYPVRRSWDFGLTPACLFIQIIDNTLYVLSEYLGSNQLIDSFVETVLDKSLVLFGKDAIYEDYCDPAGRFKSSNCIRTPIEVMNSYGVFPRWKIQQIEDGISIIRMMLNKGNIEISTDCDILRQGFMGGYHYPESYDGEGKDPEPYKDGYYDHLQDCLRYGIWDTPFREWLYKPKPITLKRKKPVNSFDNWRKFAQGKDRNFTFCVRR